MSDPEKFTDGSSSLVLGCDSYSQSAELGDKEYVMGQNVVCRGGIVQTRPGTKTIFCLPDGNFQGCTLFTPANGISQLVFAVDGYVYVSPSPFTQYRRLRDIQFSNTSKYIAWAVCTKSTDYDAQGVLISVENPYTVLMMQDGFTRAAFWDGNTARHLNPATPDFPDQTDIIPGFTETPIGLWMIWSGNRLWVSRGNQIFASDIGNPLKFTESLYLNEARAFYLSGDCTGMIEVPTDANTSKGFIAFTENDGTLFQSYIQDRTQWLSTPLFQNTIIPTVGCVAPRSLVTQYGLNWWFGPRGLTNINSALRQNITSRIDYQDNEMFSSKAYLSPDLSGICGAFYENYLMMSVPSQDVYNRHTWVLDQAPFEGNAAAWTGFWSGWRPIEWSRGIVNGAERLFFGSVDYDGKNRIWEAMLPDRTDNGCRITCYAQLREHAAGNLDRKRYLWSKLFLSQIYGNVDLNVYVASTKGSYQLQKTYRIVASQGQVFSDVQYSEQGPLLIGNIVQSRTIRTPTQPNDNECNSCGVESQEGNMIDYAFSHLLVWSGQMGLRAYQINMRREPDKDTGDCESAEVGPRSLNAAGCSGLELLIDSQVFTVFTARRDGGATLANGADVYISQVGYSVIGPENAEELAEEKVVATEAILEGADVAPGSYNNGDSIPFPDGGAGITQDTDRANVLGSAAPPGDGGSTSGGSSSQRPFVPPTPNPGGQIIVDDPVETHPNPPSFIQQPQDVTIDDGQNANFYVAVDGFLPIVFQWQVNDGMGWVNVTNGGIYAGATTQGLQLTGATTAESGYLYRCRATNEVGAVYSDSAELTVNSVVACSWTPLGISPSDGGSLLADFDSYAAAYNTITSLASSLVGLDFSLNLIGGPNISVCLPCFSVNFSAAGIYSFSLDVTIDGAWMAGPNNNVLQLFATTGGFPIDSDSQPADGPFSSTFNLNVPAPGQYLISANILRAGVQIGTKLQTQIGYTLQPGDAVCVAEGVLADLLAVGGGGGGGGHGGIGGSGGQVNSRTDWPIAIQSYNVVVGAGGAGGLAALDGDVGGDSSIDITGGFLASGGAGGVGDAGCPGDPGSAGEENSISGTTRCYGGQGGAGGCDGINPGGDGGGCASGDSGGGGHGFPNGSPAVPVANTGGGGGGGLGNGSPGPLTDGIAGAAGVVVIRYPGAALFTGGTITTDAGDTIHTFTSSGTLDPL